MTHFRKKPVVIEAFQVTVANVNGDTGQWPHWLKEAVGRVGPGSVSLIGNDTVALHIETLEGTRVASYDDWIIKGVKGELYPCKPDIFAATYDEEEPHAPDDIAEPVSRFRPKYRGLTDSEKILVESIKATAVEMEALYELVKPGRYRSLGLTALEESVMWTIKELTA